MTEPDKLITDRQVAELFAISRSSVWLWVRLGRITAPIVHQHKYTRWSHNQMQAIISAMRDGPAQEDSTNGQA